jgi:hypothetical protein
LSELLGRQEAAVEIVDPPEVIPQNLQLQFTERVPSGSCFVYWQGRCNERQLAKLTVQLAQEIIHMGSKLFSASSLASRVVLAAHAMVHMRSAAESCCAIGLFL